MLILFRSVCSPLRHLLLFFCRNMHAQCSLSSLKLKIKFPYSSMNHIISLYECFHKISLNDWIFIWSIIYIHTCIFWLIDSLIDKWWSGGDWLKNGEQMVPFVCHQPHQPLHSPKTKCGLLTTRNRTMAKTLLNRHRIIVYTHPASNNLIMYWWGMILQVCIRPT